MLERRSASVDDRGFASRAWRPAGFMACAQRRSASGGWIAEPNWTGTFTSASTGVLQRRSASVSGSQPRLTYHDGRRGGCSTPLGVGVWFTPHDPLYRPPTLRAQRRVRRRWMDRRASTSSGLATFARPSAQRRSASDRSGSRRNDQLQEFGIVETGVLNAVRRRWMDHGRRSAGSSCPLCQRVPGGRALQRRSASVDGSRGAMFVRLVAAAWTGAQRRSASVDDRGTGCVPWPQTARARSVLNAAFRRVGGWIAGLGVAPWPSHAGCAQRRSASSDVRGLAPLDGGQFACRDVPGVLNAVRRRG